MSEILCTWCEEEIEGFQHAWTATVVVKRGRTAPVSYPLGPHYHKGCAGDVSRRCQASIDRAEYMGLDPLLARTKSSCAKLEAMLDELERCRPLMWWTRTMRSEEHSRKVREGVHELRGLPTPWDPGE